jgi:hypothetical protein
LVQAGRQAARGPGYETVYATTVQAAGILDRLGWEFIKTVLDQSYPMIDDKKASND